MLVNYKEALDIFSKLDRNLRIPTLHPSFVMADSRRHDSLKPSFFVYKNADQIFYHAFQLGSIQDTDLCDVQSPYGYGGPISNSEDKKFLESAHSAYTKWCHSNKIVCEFIRFHPVLENWIWYEGEKIADRETVVVDLKVPDLLGSYVTRARTAVRKAEKTGFKVRVATPKEFLEIFSELYYSSLKELQADQSYYFSREYFSQVMETSGAHGLICQKEDKVQGGALFLTEGNVIEYHLSAASTQGKASGVTNLLLHEGFKLGQSLGCSIAHLGGGRSKTPDDKLLFFKSGFSPLKNTFKVGKKVHLHEDYKNLKSRWEGKHGKSNDRILFYR